MELKYYYKIEILYSIQQEEYFLRIFTLEV